MLASGARKGLVFGQPLRQERAAFCTRRRIKTPGAPPARPPARLQPAQASGRPSFALGTSPPPCSCGVPSRELPLCTQEGPQRDCTSCTNTLRDPMLGRLLGALRRGFQQSSVSNSTKQVARRRSAVLPWRCAAVPLCSHVATPLCCAAVLLRCHGTALHGREACTQHGARRGFLLFPVRFPPQTFV